MSNRETSDVSEELEVLGLDHLYLAVRDLARSVAFYDPVMRALGFRKGDRAIGGEPHVHYFNRVLQISLRPAGPGTPDHDSYAPGLHHLCLQVQDRAAVELAAETLQRLGVETTQPAEYPEYSPDYYAIFFEDPDGLRLEIVNRRATRRTVVERWHELDTFLNPLQRLEEKR
jgi:glyoxylase I family protein